MGNAKYHKIKQYIDRSVMGYDAFRKELYNMRLIEKLEIISFLKTFYKNDTHYRYLYEKISQDPELLYIQKNKEKLLKPEAKIAYKKYLQWLKEQKKIQDKNTRGERIGDKIAMSIFIIICCIILYFIIWPVLKFVGGIAWTGFEIFADGSFLGFVFGVAAVIITLGMFVALIKAIFG